VKIGVAVEGPSDKKFWEKVLRKHFPHPVVFPPIRTMGGRPDLIRKTPNLLEDFRGAHYDAGFILVDRDNSLNVQTVLAEFDESIQVEARRPVAERFLFICVAVRELEAWFLADEPGINALFPKANYRAPNETGEMNAEKKLRDFWKAQYQTAFHKSDLAQKMATEFSPTEAQKRSTSFKRFWERLQSKAESFVLR
jgi:hypothetical protein